MTSVLQQKNGTTLNNKNSTDDKANNDTSPRNFPYTLTIHIPLPTPRLASTAYKALNVDTELSPLVHRSFSLSSSSDSSSLSTSSSQPISNPTSENEEKNILKITYSATTNRMLRVSVNSFFDNLGVVLGCMRELDGDLYAEEWVGEGDEVVDGLDRVQGLEEGGVIGGFRVGWNGDGYG